jgi:DNA invertase Pin-like site-specific DNA recombinase
MQKAFAYLRVSGKGQTEGDGFTRQLAAIKQYAGANGFKVVRVFREEGISGTIESMDRPAWAEMMTVLHSNGVRTILIERLDRLARDLMVQEAAIADLRKHGFNLLSVTEPDLMANDPTRVLMRQLMGTVAQYDKSQIVAKLRGARMRKRAKEGRCEGRKPYGFYDGEPEIIERMKALRESGMGFDRVAATLNSEGIMPRSGKRWGGFTVNKILTGKYRVGKGNN